jgi:hypothetical protein
MPIKDSSNRSRLGKTRAKSKALPKTARSVRLTKSQQAKVDAAAAKPTQNVPDRPEFYIQTGSMFENPYGVPHDEIVSMILELPAEVAAQVVFGKYVESSGLVFSAELIQMMLDRDGVHYHGQQTHRVTGDNWFDTQAMGQAKLIGHAQKRNLFATEIDLARLNDYTVIFTLDLRHMPARVVGYRRLNRVPWETIYREIGRTVALWGPSVLMDSTGMAGDVIQDALEDRHYCTIHDRTLLRQDGFCTNGTGDALGGCRADMMLPLSCVDGFYFTKSGKQALIEHLRNALSVGYLYGSDEPFGWVRCPPIVSLEEELSFYAWDDKQLDTDTVMSLALACWQGLELSVGDSHFGSPYGG